VRLEKELVGKIDDSDRVTATEAPRQLQIQILLRELLRLDQLAKCFLFLGRQEYRLLTVD
jgi:hypothetical protein